METWVKILIIVTVIIIIISVVAVLLWIFVFAALLGSLPGGPFFLPVAGVLETLLIS